MCLLLQEEKVHEEIKGDELDETEVEAKRLQRVMPIVRELMEDEEIRQWKLERSDIQDVNIRAISQKSRIQNTLWVKFCCTFHWFLQLLHGRLILMPMTLPGISSQFQEPHPSGESREDFMKGWRIWGWFCMCVFFKITHSDFILYMNTLCIEYTCHIYIFTWYGNNAKIEASRMGKHQRCCTHREGSLSKLPNLCSRDLA